MKRSQRYRLEMFGRVRDFGKTNSDLFPESSTGGLMFAQVAAAVAAIEAHLTKRDLARAEARRVKATTRAAVMHAMKTIARTARRATRDETIPHAFVLPRQKSVAALLAKARLFIDEAKPREAKFIALGLPATFISDFTALVARLHEAVEVRQGARGLREMAQTGIERAIADGYEAIRTLDVLVLNALEGDPVRVGYWRGARHLEGVNGASSKAAPEPSATTPDVALDPQRKAS